METPPSTPSKQLIVLLQMLHVEVVTWDDWQLPSYQGGQLISWFFWLVEGFRVLDKQLWNCLFVSFLAMQTWAACCRRRQWVLDGWWTKIFWRLWVINLHFARHHHETYMKSQNAKVPQEYKGCLEYVQVWVLLCPQNELFCALCIHYSSELFNIKQELKKAQHVFRAFSIDLWPSWSQIPLFNTCQKPLSMQDV